MVLRFRPLSNKAQQKERSDGRVCVHTDDRDGVVVIPQERAEEVIEKAEQAVNAEDKVRAAILDGVDPKEAYLKFGKF